MHYVSKVFILRISIQACEVHSLVMLLELNYGSDASSSEIYSFVPTLSAVDSAAL